MLDVIKRLVGRNATPAPSIECVFSLDAKKRKLYLLDLATILRLPDARIALPDICHLEQTVRRNRTRIRIPHEAMLRLVRELLTVRHRIPAGSPLHDIMKAIPGLVHGVFGESGPMPSAFPGNTSAIRLPAISRADQDAEVERIRNLIAGNKPTATPVGATPRRNGPVPAAGRQSLGATKSDQSGASLGALRKPDPPIPSHQGRVERDPDPVESSAASTRDLPDEEFAAYVDLCIVNGDHQHVIAMLAERVAEQPRAWAWSRLLEFAEAAGDARFGEFRARFVRWTEEHHPRLIHSLPADDDRTLFYGIPREALQQLGRAEMGLQGQR